MHTPIDKPDAGSTVQSTPCRTESNPLLLTQRIQGEIRANVGAEKFHRWFTSLVFVEERAGSIFLGVPNLFIRDWIQQKYRAVLNQVIFSLFGSEQVEIIVDGHLFREFRRAEAEFLELVEPRANRLDAAQGGQVPVACASCAEAGIVAPAALASGVPAPAPMPADPPGRPAKVDTGHARTQPAGVEQSASSYPGLNERLTLDSFVVGSCNHVAFNAAREILLSPGDFYNPLFVYGGSGLGKTHLLQGLTREYFRQGERNIRYQECERFSNRLNRALQERTIDQFRRYYAGLKVLVLDDLHILEKRPKTQLELLHIVDGVIAAGGQVVLASDTNPQRLRGIQKPLQNRMVSGLICKVEPPDHRTRLAILASEIQKARADVPESVRLFIADNFAQNVRELVGALVRVIGSAALLHEPITEAGARRILEAQVWKSQGGIGLEDIVGLVSEYYGITPDLILARTRGRAVSNARQVAIYLARVMSDYSLAELGNFFGGRNHATINFSFRKILVALRTNSAVQGEVASLVARLNRRS